MFFIRESSFYFLFNIMIGMDFLMNEMYSSFCMFLSCLPKTCGLLDPKWRGYQASPTTYNLASKQYIGGPPHNIMLATSIGAVQAMTSEAAKPDAIHLLLTASEEQISSIIGLELKALLCIYLLLLLQSFTISRTTAFNSSLKYVNFLIEDCLVMILVSLVH